jgi:hypothetical protein
MIPKILPNVPGAIGARPIPKPVEINNDGYLKTVFGFMLMIQK